MDKITFLGVRNGSYSTFKATRADVDASAKEFGFSRVLGAVDSEGADLIVTEMNLLLEHSQHLSKIEEAFKTFQELLDL